jgi:hypothetical protein
MVLLVLVAMLVGVVGPAVSRDGADAVDYARDIKPVLMARCVSCHGAIQHKGGLRLDTARAMIAGGDSGPAIEPGHVEDSLLLDRVTAEEGRRMPPEGEPLTSLQVERLREWVAHGATAPEDEAPQADPADHWAFQAPKRPAVPSLASAPISPSWARNPIDAFIAARLEDRGLRPSPEADRATLLRRASLDLTGLAPTRDELHAFLDDTSSDAYEKAVERLLASPRHGERWGRHWMDIWRYSDWDGYGAEVRESQPHIWRWRDWIVKSLNEDVGYDAMTRAMLAGDEVAPDDPDTLAATGYLARNWSKFSRDAWLQNTVDHTAKAFLGLTLACARCHDHKYDPIAQREWYEFRAIFEPHEIATDRVPGQADTTRDGLARVFDAHADRATHLFRRGNEKEPVTETALAPGVPRIFRSSFNLSPVGLPATAFYPGLRAHVRDETAAASRTAVAAAQAKCAEAEAANAPDLLAVERELKAAIAEWEFTSARLEADAATYASGPDEDPGKIEWLKVRAGLAGRRAALARAEATQARADHDLALARSKGAEKTDDAKVKEALTAAKKAAEVAKTRADEARKANDERLPRDYPPLTALRPRASTGRRLALANWITDRANPLTARVAVNHVWVRHMNAPLVATMFDFGLNGRKPVNPELLDWLAVEFMESGWSFKHLHRLIVTSATYRMRSWHEPGGPNAAIDPGNEHLWRMNPARMEAELVRDNVLHVAGSLDTTIGGPDLDPNQGQTTPRRSLYFRHAKEKRVTFLKVFDSANVGSCYRRDVSVVPQQALALMNSPLALGQARVLAGKLTKELGDHDTDTDAFLTAAFEQVLGRLPTEDERAACRDYLRAERDAVSDPSKLSPFGGPATCPVPPSSDPSQRARENLIHVLINHDDFVTIR